jgi:hypothetical protein
VFGHGPHAPHQRTGHGHDHLVGMCPSGQQASGACAPSPLGFPAHVLHGFGWCCQAALEMPADVSGVTGGPGAFHEHATRMRVAGCGARTLPASRATGRRRGDQPQACHALSGMIEGCQVAECRHRGDGHGALDPTQGVEGLDDRVSTPSLDRFVACLVQSLASRGVFMDGSAVCLEDHVLSRCGTDDCREPSAVGRAPSGPARRADVMSEPEGFETALSRLEVSQGIFTGAGELANGVIFDRGNGDGGEITRAHEAGQLHRVPAVGVHTVAGLVGHQGGRDDPADLAVLRQIAREPGPTGSCFIDHDQVWGLGLQRADALITVGVPGADRAAVDDLGAVVFGNRGDRDGRCMDSQADIERARLWHG